MSDPFRENPNVGGRLLEGVNPTFDLAARLRAALSVKAIDPTNGAVAVAFPAPVFDRLIVALDVAREAIPWIGVEEIRDRLEEALA